MKLTIGIKAFNEEKNIARAIESALHAAAPYDGEVVVADCGSTDATRSIAARYPVRLVRLLNPAERSCGTGAQLAFQHARGTYFYMLDGDMVLDPTVIPLAMARLDSDNGLAGVGGQIDERNLKAADFRVRAATRPHHWGSGPVDRLDCGGLYRSDAVRKAGYFADRNLHAFEEFDLGARLAAKGFGLARIDAHAADHFGHATSSARLLLRRVMTGYAGAVGEVARSAFGQPHLAFVLKHFSHLRFSIVVICWWFVAIALSFAPITWPLKAALLAAILGLPIMMLSWRRGSLALGLHSLIAWNVCAIGLVSGLFRTRVNPTSRIDSVVERDVELAGVDVD